MSALADHVQDYLRLRRALGYKLERAGHLLPKLVDYMQEAGSRTLTTDLAIAWARLPASRPFIAHAMASRSLMPWDGTTTRSSRSDR